MADEGRHGPVETLPAVNSESENPKPSPFWGRIQWQHSPLGRLFRRAVPDLPGRAPARLTTLAPNPRTTPVGEWPTQAAVRIGDRIFTGDSHFDAVSKAQAALGEGVTHRLLDKGGPNVALDGFLTNKGRYVSREEAGRMLDEHNGTNRFTSGWLTGRPRRGLDSLLSEALENYNLATGRRT